MNIKELIAINTELLDFSVPTEEELATQMMPFIFLHECEKPALAILLQCEDFDSIGLVECRDGSGDTWDRLVVFYAK